ncbi:MAG: hypothetical protein ACTS5I_05990 [Rhodanobacter sp.]
MVHLDGVDRRQQIDRGGDNDSQTYDAVPMSHSDLVNVPTPGLVNAVRQASLRQREWVERR